MSSKDATGVVTVAVPEPLRAYTDGQAEVSVQAGTVADVLRELALRHDGIGAQMIDGSGKLRHGVSIAVGDRDIRFAEQLSTCVQPGGRVQIVVTMVV